MYVEKQWYHVANLDPDGNKWAGVRAESGEPVTEMFANKRLAAIALSDYIRENKNNRKEIIDENFES